jgi:dTDP-4-amino-4,6-dideoxygalactose transaminase
MFGIPSAVDRILARCRPRGIFVVEDAAQAMGATRDGRPVGTAGDVGIFSLGRGKNVTCGSGGVVVTRSDRIADAVARRYRAVGAPGRLRSLKDLVEVGLMTLLIRPRLYWLPAALPFLRLGQTIFPETVPIARLSGTKAGLLRDWRTRLARANRSRSETVSFFARQLRLRPVAGPAHPYLRLPVLAASPDDRARLCALSERRGLGLSGAYPTPINEIAQIRSAFDGQTFPSAASVAKRLVTIPTHQLLSDRDKRAISALWRQASTG